MKNIHKFVSEPFAKSAARVMKYGCYFVMLFLAAGLILSGAGRQTFTLIQADAKAGGELIYPSWGLRVSTNDDIRVFSDTGGIDGTVRLGLSAIFAAGAIPLAVAYWYLSRVFENISKGQIFTERNAFFLLRYGLIRIAAAVLIPMVKLMISHLANQFTNNVISIHAQLNLFDDAIPQLACIVAAYIIYYGAHLQDEVDHTL